MKLSETQQKVLSKMQTEIGVWHSAYSLQCSLATLYAMERKGVIERQKGWIAGEVKPGLFLTAEQMEQLLDGDTIEIQWANLEIGLGLVIH